MSQDRVLSAQSANGAASGPAQGEALGSEKYNSEP